MKKSGFRIALMVALCFVGGYMGAFLAQTGPTAEAAPTMSVAAGVASSAQGVYGAGGPYTVVPVMDSGAGYSWMAYAIAFSPEGHVTIINTHPKKTDAMGTVVREFDIK